MEDVPPPLSPLPGSGESRGEHPTGRRYGGCASIHYTSLLSPLPGSGESRREHPTGRRYGGCASINYFSLLPPFLPGRGPGGWSAPLSRPKPRTAGAQRRVAAWPSTTVAVVVPPVHEAGSPEGSIPTGRRYGGCASIHYTSLLSPLPGRKGARGMVPLSRPKPRTARAPQRRVAAHYGGRGPGGWSAPALRAKRGVQRGAPPLAGGMEDVPPYTTLLYYPPSWKEGGQGDGPLPHYGAYKRGSPEGSTPTGRRYGGCASIHYTSSLSPLPGRKGARGMVRSRTTVHEAGSPEGSPPTGRLPGIPRYNEGGVTCLRPPTFQEHKELFL